jgi:hypothetical protein
MASPGTKLYDRKTIVDVIQRDCLGTPGSSGVVVGAQKIGKTCLLGHVWSLGNKRKETIFCRLDIDSLEAAGFSDDSFMRLFLSELRDALAQSIAQMEDHEPQWLAELAKSKVGTRTSASGAAEIIRTGMEELSGLRKVSNLIEKLLERTDVLEPALTFAVFNVLRQSGKRVVLVIDEFHRMMRERGFSNRLFAFLRGASTQGKILTLVSSTVHLMDPSLHGPNVDNTYDRLNLFNHYQVQFLEPFSESEAEGFLDWLPPVNPSLTADEKTYLYQLGGGSPHFLKRARTLFLEKGRPQTASARNEFEARHAGPGLEPDFYLLWARCSPEERAVLAELGANGTSNSPLVAKLEREGYVVKIAGGVLLFSAMFAKFVREQKVSSKSKKVAEDSPSMGQVTLDKFGLVSETFVTALGLARPEAAEIFAIEVTNRGKSAIKVRVACRVVDYSQATIREYSVAPGTQKLYGYAYLRPKALRKLDNPVPTNVDYRISLAGVTPENILGSGQVGIQLLPPNNFLMAVFDPTSEQLKNRTWLIAAWVRRRGSNLQEVLKAAGQICELQGYQAGQGQGIAEHTRRQVSAIYKAVKDWGIQYQNSAQVYLNDKDHYLQQVRFPEESLSDHSANCLDMAVLFASLLSSCQISPLVLLVPGHALVGWKDGAGGLEFIQTTGIAETNFENARSIGMQYFEARKKECEAWLESGADAIEDPSEFSILIDVDQISRTRKLMKV